MVLWIRGLRLPSPLTGHHAPNAACPVCRSVPTAWHHLGVGTSKAEAAKHADVAWRARVAGASWAEAAQIAGYVDATGACAAVRKWYGQLPEIEHEDQRTLWRNRLESLWRQAVIDVRDRQHGAITAAVRVGGLAMQLDGLAMPTKVSLTAETSLDSLISALSTPVVVQGEVIAGVGDD